jgi:hypothetical protein
MNNSELAPRFANPEQEIAFLRGQISNKELELREKKIEYKIEDVVQGEISRYRDVLPKEVLDDTYALAEKDLESIELNLVPERHDKKMEELLGILQEKGIKNTMSVLAGFKDPHLEDDFHRFLVQYIKRGYEAKNIDIENREFRGLNMTLYEVVLPEDSRGNAEQVKTRPLKELISGMEQFLSGMLSVTTKDDTRTYKENYIVLEVANPNGSDQFVFYVAVPNIHKDLFEKQMISVFHNARLMEATSDYNIFNSDGVSVGSNLELAESPVYPFKTYEVFDQDPMNVILNSFSKIEKDGEGAGIQMIFAPKGDYYNKKYAYTIEEIEKGVPVKEAVNVPESISGEFGKTLKSFFKSSPKPDMEKKPADPEAIQKIKQKISSPIVATNIRLIASAKSRIDAERILRSIESGFNQFTDTASNGLKAERYERRISFASQKGLCEY